MDDGYRTQALDTERDIEERLFAAYRVMTPQQKLDCWWDLWESTIELVRASIRMHRPELVDEAVELELARRMVGNELAETIHQRRRACTKPTTSSSK